jgi:fatty acid desaturase
MPTTGAMGGTMPKPVKSSIRTEPAANLALPTVGVYVGALTVFVASTFAFISGRSPVWATVAANATVTFVMFTVVHDATHHSISNKRWVNGLFGRLAWLFVAPLISFPSFAYIHLQHHRHANDDANDPGTFASHGRVWQLPFRWALAGVFYARFLGPRLGSRPKAEVAETAAMFTAGLTGVVAAILTGHLWTLAVVFLLPEHLGLIVLEWWFDWLPHHGLEDTQQSNRYRAARVRVGMEWLFTPLMLSQNYHLVHHLNPSVPFYRYVRTWRRNEDTYLKREVAIATILGRQLTPDEFRQWQELNARRLLPVRLPERASHRAPA